MKQSVKKRIAVLIVVVFISGAGSIAWLWFQPHRDVRSASVDRQVTVDDLTNAFTQNAKAANATFLSSDGNSKILLVTGPVYAVSSNAAGEAVVLLKADSAKVGVLATFLKAGHDKALALKKGQLVKLKGAIVSGNSYDADLDLYEHATLIQCSFAE